MIYNQRKSIELINEWIDWFRTIAIAGSPTDAVHRAASALPVPAPADEPQLAAAGRYKDPSNILFDTFDIFIGVIHSLLIPIY